MNKRVVSPRLKSISSLLLAGVVLALAAPACIIDTFTLTTLASTGTTHPKIEAYVPVPYVQPGASVSLVAINPATNATTVLQTITAPTDPSTYGQYQWEHLVFNNITIPQNAWAVQNGRHRSYVYVRGTSGVKAARVLENSNQVSCLQEKINAGDNYYTYGGAACSNGVVLPTPTWQITFDAP